MLRTPIQLLDLPPEILILILSHMDLPTLASCLTTNQRVKSIIDPNIGWLPLKPLASRTTLGMKLTLLTSLSPFNNGRSILRNLRLDHFYFDIYALSGGIFAATEIYSGFLEWFSLATNACVWQRLEFHVYIQDFALAVPEEDLLAIILTFVIVFDSGYINESNLELQVQTAPSKWRFPRSRETSFLRDIDAVRSPNGPPTYHSLGSLFVRNKPPSHIRLEGGFPSPGSFRQVFNCHNVPEGTVACPRLVLKLPQLAKPGTYTIYIADSNPKGHGSLTSQEPFQSSFTDSILLFLVLILFDDGTDAEMFLVLSRRALLQLLPSVEKYEKELSWREWGPPITNWVETDANTWSPITKLARTQRDATGEEPRICAVSGEDVEMVDSLSLGIFGEQVSSHLGCVVVDFPEETVYNGVLLDEKWIVGVKESDVGGKVSFDVWHLIFLLSLFILDDLNSSRPQTYVQCFCSVSYPFRVPPLQPT
ncbi:hypothetical protein C8F04DRAFT_1297629 [Mycena alexandri]|uniref:F-box domain-containing protein n=1 Tax=Mycena alexandri TaxID=1745969 RepID=A0AAD6TBS7_9AGAR|nr:hypothetical protein C8F04DRAFT_1297629 [Mycena alexandri]